MSYLNVVAVLKHAPVFVEKAYSIVFTSYVHLIIHGCIIIIMIARLTANNTITECINPSET